MSNFSRSFTQDSADEHSAEDIIWSYIRTFHYYTVAQLAAEMGVKDSTIYAWLSDERRLPFDLVEWIADDIYEREGRVELAQKLIDKRREEITPRGTGLADGCTLQEQNDLYEATTEIGQAHREGNAEAMTEHIREAERNIEILKGERDRIK